MECVDVVDNEKGACADDAMGYIQDIASSSAMSGSRWEALSFEVIVTTR